jgi:hypothetical protein
MRALSRSAWLWVWTMCSCDDSAQVRVRGFGSQIVEGEQAADLGGVRVRQVAQQAVFLGFGHRVSFRAAGVNKEAGHGHFHADRADSCRSRFTPSSTRLRHTRLPGAAATRRTTWAASSSRRSRSSQRSPSLSGVRRARWRRAGRNARPTARRAPRAPRARAHHSRRRPGPSRPATAGHAPPCDAEAG